MLEVRLNCAVGKCFKRAADTWGPEPGNILPHLYLNLLPLKKMLLLQTVLI